MRKAIVISGSKSQGKRHANQKGESVTDNTDEFVCGFCMAVIVSPDYPDECHHCHVGHCKDCGTFNRHDSAKWCHGCGKISPEIKALFVRTSYTASAYLQRDWIKMTLGHGCKPHQIVSGLRNGTWGNVWLECDREFVRDLTDEERTLLGYKTRAEFEQAMAESKKEKPCEEN